MLDHTRARTTEFQRRMQENDVGLVVLTHEASIAYLAGFWGYLSVEFGRPTMMVIRPDQPPTVLAPLLESEMVEAMTWVEDVRAWEDSGRRGWDAFLGETIGSDTRVWVELSQIPAIVRNWFDAADIDLEDISPIMREMRTVKGPDEIETMRQAGLVGHAMMQAAHESLTVGAPEYETALAISAAGTRKAAEFLSADGWERFVSPIIYGLQIMQSGRDTSMVHRRASVKLVESGDPIYLCFCNRIQFKHYSMGFDRMFFMDSISDEAARVQQATIDAQRAAFEAMRPGVTAESVTMAANAVYEDNGYESGYRTGRAIGVAELETPELKMGDTTVLRPGMTFAVDGGISVDGELGGRIGDTVLVTEIGAEFLTEYSREILVVAR